MVNRRLSLDREWRSAAATGVPGRALDYVAVVRRLVCFSFLSLLCILSALRLELLHLMLGKVAFVIARWYGDVELLQ
jgi:hypothetical protein